MRGVQLLLLGSTTFIVHAAPLDRVGRIAGMQKVVNGQDAPEDKYPWVVGLDAVVSGDTYSCGGSLIAPGYVLTAAHCFFPSDGKAAGTVHFGSHETCFYGDCDSETRTIAEAIIHPNYNDRSSANDVAILKLSKPMNTIEPVPIKRAAFNSQDTFGDGLNKAATTLGWGVINTNTEAMGKVLQQGDVNLISRTDCGTNFGYAKSDIKAGMVCANHPKGTDACQGDSGGPLFSPSLGELVGVVSWGAGCGKKNFPGVYADVGQYYEWIVGITGALDGGNGGGGSTDAPATDTPATDAPTTETECVCQDTWNFGGGSYAGCAFTPDDLSQAWCYTTEKCIGSTPSQSSNQFWTNCDTTSPATDAPATDAPATKAPTTDAPTTDEPTTDEPTTDEPKTDAPSTDACECRDKWSYEPRPFGGYETFAGCADTDGSGAHWCFTTAECTGSTPSTLYDGWHWAECKAADEAVSKCPALKKNPCKKDSACTWKRGECIDKPEPGSCAAANKFKTCKKANNGECDWVEKKCVDELVCEDSTSKCCSKNKSSCKKDIDCEFHRNNQCMPAPSFGDEYAYAFYDDY